MSSTPLRARIGPAKSRLRVKHRAERVYTSRIKLPIYGSTLWFAMADTAKIAHDYLVKKGEFPKWGDGEEYEYFALCCNKANTFGIFFGLDDRGMGTLSHEVFHMTHRILEFTGCRFDHGDNENHEHAALLNGQIFDWAYDNHKEAIKSLAK